MRWFSPAWATATDAAHEATVVSYREHITRLRPRLPATLRQLVEGGGEAISLHDARFVDILQTGGRLLVDVVGWDWPSGVLDGNVWIYPALHLRLAHDAAELLSPSWDQLPDAACEILYGELDEADGDGFEHRMLIWPSPQRHGAADPHEAQFEFAVRFRDSTIASARFDGSRVSVIDCELES